MIAVGVIDTIWVDDGELEQNSVISILETTAADGKNYKTKYYNCEAIISVGYRVNSRQGSLTLFEEGLERSDQY